MNRLQFIRLLGTAFAGVTLAPHLVTSALAQDKKSADSSDQNSISGDPLKADVSKPVTVVILGAGARGRTYASYAKDFPDCMKVVGVADINEYRKKDMAKKHDIPANAQFGDWSEAIAAGKIADAVVISLPDDLHYEPCMKALELGYDVLLEKPVAQTEEECVAIRDKANEKGAIVAVCHVLRYAPYFIALKAVIDSGAIGKLISVQHLEPIQYAHMAHSYVRGNWHNAKQTTPIILAKSCHDLDILRWLVGQPCKSIAAYGSLTYFTPENKPEGATERCTDGCPHEATCPYSAIDIYVNKQQHLGVFDALPPKSEPEARAKKIRDYLATTDYGRCVFAMDNDQPDHYVSCMEFADGTTASFSMEAFMARGGRRTRVMGTKGEIDGDMHKFVMTDFRTGKKTEWDAKTVKEVAAYAAHGHGGGDFGLARDFVNAVGHHDVNRLSSDINVSMESHIMGFAAEKSRLGEGKQRI
jgi:predicted dehydrogenase